MLGTSRAATDATAGETAWRWSQLDVCDAQRCAELVQEERPDVVFHLASKVSGAREPEMVLPMLHSNLLGTVHLLAALQGLGAGRFVQVGSQEEPLAPRDAPPSPYAAAKVCASTYCRLFATLYGVPVGVARVFMVYGPGPQDTNKLVPYVVRSLLGGEPARLMSGERLVDWIYVEDVAAGLMRLGERLEQTWQSGRRTIEVDLGSGTATSVRDVVEQLLLATGKGAEAVSYGAVPDRAREVEVTAAVEATEEALDWRPRVSLEQGLQRTVAWFREHSEP